MITASASSSLRPNVLSFYKLFVIDASDGSLMDDLGVHMLRVDLRDGADLRLIHDNGIALDMRMAPAASNGSWMEHLTGVSFTDRTGYDPGRTVLSI